MLSAILSIAGGGALGSVARYGVGVASGRWLGLGFPYGTLIVNVLGSFVIGLLIALFARHGQPSENVRLFLVTGFLGGFTTFSAFSLDVITLWERQAIGASLFYLTASIGASLAALVAALFLVRGISS